MASRSDKIRRRQHRKEKKERRQASKVAAQHAAWFNQPASPVFSMSDALLTLLEPVLDGWRNEEELRKLLTLGMAAWNLAIETGEKRTALLDKLAQTLPAEIRDDFPGVLQPLIERKEQLFPNIQRRMLNYHIQWLPSGEPHVLVMSTMD